ncbi:histidine--tRNA ligase [candidate division WOR-3 bacterium JGI_Cruoil_03_51_56]|uniref:Histidine--tRNA ligase n=1 Tax=candidate division WOR-3 bacterium JGI_Cruoil_03_51_56 TaxID=1973747 RepID=A0A235BUA2_UNCW3|nr:MAG: histidine--tRNA ligase [candidate division WOR-3 bacterium JGI_Cruoil_03_51_56]
MSNPKHTRPKGTQDFVPPRAEQKSKVEDVFRHLAERFGFQEIVIPTFEYTDVFVKSSGTGSDIVTKEMYTFKDRADRSLTLRPEGTGGVVRAVLENRLRIPCRLYYLGPYFRYGRPQKGRFREFFQLGVEALGEASPLVDAETILFGDEFFRELGISDCITRLNSIGCRNCRPAYQHKLVEFLSSHKDRLCSECQLRLKHNPLRVFDCKQEQCQAVLKDAPKPGDYLCPECSRHFKAVQASLDKQGLRYELNGRLVRGLDYYNRTTFEFVSSKLGAQDSIGGGGRYDYLVEDFGGPQTPAIGLAIGLERTMLAMGEKEQARRRLAFVVWMGDAELDEAQKVLARLRAQGIPAQMDYDAHRMKHQFKSADAAGASCCVIIGADELAKGVYSLKDLTTGRQIQVPVSELIGTVQKLIRAQSVATRR